MAKNVYFEDVKVGDEVPAFERKTDFMNWNRYAAVNDEFVFLHMDDEVGKAAGQGAAFGMGNLRWAYVLNALRNWIGDEAQVRELSMQFRAINHKNDVLTTVATVAQKRVEGAEHLIDLEINVRNQDGVMTAPGHATRCVETDFVRAFAARKTELEDTGVDPKARWAELETLNLGRLRIASKGIVRDDTGLVTVDPDHQRREGARSVSQGLLAAARGRDAVTSPRRDRKRQRVAGHHPTRDAFVGDLLHTRARRYDT